MTIVGLHGAAGAGKDTAGQYLVKRGWTRYAFADKLRAAALGVNPIVVPETQARLAGVVDEMGWDSAKRSIPEVRGTLERLGTQMGRDVFGENFWLNALHDQIRLENPKAVVITDVRFPNEAEWVLEQNGVVIEVTSAETEKLAGSHASRLRLPAELITATTRNPRDESFEQIFIEDLGRALRRKPRMPLVPLDKTPKCRKG